MLDSSLKQPETRLRTFLNLFFHNAGANASAQRREGAKSLRDLGLLGDRGSSVQSGVMSWTSLEVTLDNANITTREILGCIQRRHKLLNALDLKTTMPKKPHMKTVPAKVVTSKVPLPSKARKGVADLDRNENKAGPKRPFLQRGQGANTATLRQSAKKRANEKRLTGGSAWAKATLRDCMHSPAPRNEMFR